MSRLGVLVNPIAGMGGRVGLHGTDSAKLAAAIAAGASRVAPARMQRALTRLAAVRPDLEVFTAGGEMGANLMPSAWSAHAVAYPADPTTAADTRQSVQRFVDRGVDLVIFGGGDGTARDVAEVVTERVPIVGVPCGVKMHSAVFATGPEAAADVCARYLRQPGAVRRAEVLDVTRGGLHTMAIATVPDLPDGLQRTKSSVGHDGELPALGRSLAASMMPGRLYLLGPGTTVAHVSAALGLRASLLGVDVVLDRRLIASDASEAQLLALLRKHATATLVLGVVGGQGFLLGRGNQQLSPAVLRAVGAHAIEIVASAAKIAALDPPVLRIDLDDPEVAAQISGYRRVRTSAQRSTVMRIVG